MAARRLKAVPTITEKHLDTYPYPECRGDVHQWLPYDGRLDETRKIGYRIQQCAHCPTKRKSQLRAEGPSRGTYLKKPTYDYPKDYKIEGGLDSREKGQLRMINFMQEISQVKKKKS
jgi:hypothetical protein